MAKRENQGLQIALIVFVVITVVLSLTTFFFWNRSQDLTKEAETLRRDTQEARNQRSEIQRENGQLRGWLGQENSSLDEIRTKYEQDMLSYALGVQEQDRNYGTLPQYLADARSDTSNKLSEAESEIRKLKEEKESVRLQANRRAQEAVDKQRELQADLEQERTKFNSTLAEVNKTKDELDRRLRKTTADMQAKIDERDKHVKDLDHAIAQMEIRNNSLTRELKELTEGTLEVPDGKIVGVNQRLNRVWVNLGSADGLRRQLTFGVYDVDENNLARSERKASIEITRITGDHYAEARIKTPTHTNPILRNDVIYSPLWRPGRRLRFAMVGFIDINGDEESDRQRLRDLIEMSGGVIDAEVDEKGKRTGELSIHTRYLIQGDRPKFDREDADQDHKEILEGYGNILDEAQTLGVELITVDRLLGYLDYADDDRTVTLGGNQANGRFRERHPPARSTSNGF